MLHLLMDMRDDIAMVAIHGNQSTVDPCNNAQCDTLFNYMGTGGWPYGAFNRSVGWEDDVTIANGIGYNAEYQQEVASALSSFLDYLADATPSFATVNINSTMDPDTRDAVITIDGNLVPSYEDFMGTDSKLTVYLTEDGLVAPQVNGGNDYVHNNVMRVALGSVLGVALNKTDDSYKNVFNYTIPQEWNADNMHIVAFISRPLGNPVTDIYVTNANKRKFGESDEPAFVRGDVDGDGNVNIDDVTTLINCLLQGLDPEGNGDCDDSGNVSIDDVTTLINYLLSGNW